MGPITVFDKSFLHGLSPNESVWFDLLYMPVIVPIFFAETLADLEKNNPERDPIKMVQEIANKVPLASSVVNTHHKKLIISELLGQKIEIRGVPIKNGGISFNSENKVGVYYKQSDEEEAFIRWKKRDFREVERLYAKKWRNSLLTFNFDQLSKNSEILFKKYSKPKDLSSVKKLVDTYMGQKENKDLIFTKALNYVPQSLWGEIIQRWNLMGSPYLYNFGLYTNYIIGLDLFFEFAYGANLITKNKTNKFDLAYLYYLPFCKVFISSDKFHKRVVPLFIQGDQSYINGEELKLDLIKLNSYYSSFPDNIKKLGAFLIATYPPRESTYLTTKLWDKYLPAWRKQAPVNPFDVKLPKTNPKLLERLMRSKIDANTPAKKVNITSQPDMMTVQRIIPSKKGDWNLFPPDIKS